MRTAENSAIGLDNVVIAKLLNDDANGVSYDTPIALKGAVNCSANPNSSVETDYADNGAFFVSDSRGNLELNLELTNVAPDTLALMLGQKRENGITVETSQDQAPYFALGFRVWIGGVDGNGEKIYKLFWLAKGKFSVPETAGQTKAESISFQHVSMVASFVSTIWSPDGKGGVFSANCRTDYDTPATIIQNWFNQPVLNTSADLTAFEISVSLAGTGNKKLEITIAKESEVASKLAIDTARLGETIIITNEGDNVAGAFEYDGNKLVFVPETSIASGTNVVIVTSGLKDVNGVSASPEVITVS